MVEHTHQAGSVLCTRCASPIFTRSLDDTRERNIRAHAHAASTRAGYSASLPHPSHAAQRHPFATRSSALPSRRRNVHFPSCG